MPVRYSQRLPPPDCCVTAPARQCCANGERSIVRCVRLRRGHTTECRRQTSRNSIQNTYGHHCIFFTSPGGLSVLPSCASGAHHALDQRCCTHHPVDDRPECFQCASRALL